MQIIRVTVPLRAGTLLMVRELVCLWDSGSLAVRLGLKLLAGLNKPGRSRRKDRTKPTTSSSRLEIGRGANDTTPYKQPCYGIYHKTYNYHRGPCGVLEPDILAV